MESFIGSVILFAGTFAPRGWAFCDGQIMSIAQNSALFSIVGTTYGGNGQTTFALPDLRGRVPVGPRQGPGLNSVALGQQDGQEAVTLQTSELPQHSHGVPVSTNPASSTRPTGAVPARGGSYAAPGEANGAGAPVATAGGNQPHTNLPPRLGVNYIICLEGIYPSRN